VRDFEGRKEAAMLKHILLYPWRLVPVAAQKRQRMSRAEAALWQELKGRKLLGMKFERQRPLDSCIVDFYCVRLGLAIDVDPVPTGEPYSALDERERDVRLRLSGVTVLRFSDDEVVHNLDGVLSRIRQTVRYLPLR
jgi:very-short-patch-repair endonuclease